MIVSVKNVDDDTQSLKLLQFQQPDYQDQAECRLVLKKKGSESFLSESTTGSNREQNTTKSSLLIENKEEDSIT